MLRVVTILIAVVAATPAAAHTLTGAASFGAGFAHPLLGLDHLLAMVAVGLWAGQLGGRARWLVPTAFLGTIALGAQLYQAGLHLSLVEPGVIASLLVLGLVVAWSPRLPRWMPAALVALFALAHGQA